MCVDGRIVETKHARRSKYSIYGEEDEEAWYKRCIWMQTQAHTRGYNDFIYA